MSYVVYAHGHRPPDQFARIYVPVIADRDYARSWLSFFLKDQQYQRDGDTLHLQNGYRLKSDRLDELLPVIDDPKPLREDDSRCILKFKYGSWDEKHDQPAPTIETVEPSTVESVKPKPAKADSKSKAQRPDGYVTITELCAASGVPASDARALLRASGRDKPEYGWAFAPSDLPAVKKLIGIKK